MNMPNFKKVIYSITQAQGMTVGTFHKASITPNFHACQLSHPHGLTLFVLCSINDDWAFAKTFHPMTWGLEFTDHSGLASSLRESYGIEVLEKKELDGPFSSRPYLHNYDIKRWKPKTLGEGLFNWWD
ncbi:hypothetical protein [Desulfoluna butyratoxydans]|uniref:hypothetical protein n=1 Tax=Desulfoluna butyratoxydans TaxID=231438 RepID=UPI0015D1E16F|nr:hypothetical protein [Desulfoluna butyratoxydans]